MTATDPILASQRELFSLPPDEHYINCAYMSPLSRHVEEAGIAGVRRKTNPANISSEDFFTDVAEVRRLFAGVINAPDANRIAIMPSVSYGISTVARNTVIESGQNVVVLQDQFPSNVYPWRRLCDENDATLRTIAQPPSAPGQGQRWNEALIDAIDERTRVVAVPNVHWTDGTRFDLERVSMRASEVDAALVVDGTQSIGAAPFDVERVKPDAVICGAYKWLGGPYSISAAYYGPRYDDGIPIEEAWIARAGSEDFNRLVDYRDEYRPGATRFDMGEVSNFTVLPMLIAALQQTLEWGPQIGAYCRKLTSPLIAELQDAGFGLPDAASRSDHMFGFRVPEEYDMDALRSRLARRKVSVALRGGAVRVAPYVYNDESDIAALREAVLGSEQ